METVQRFDARAADYARYRERYDPGIVLPRLIEWCGLAPVWRIADIGAGTSLLGMTLSHAPRATAPEYAKFEQQLRAFFERFAAADAVTLETRYWLNVGRFEK
jgi:hypothetical protein